VQRKKVAVGEWLRGCVQREAAAARQLKPDGLVATVHDELQLDTGEAVGRHEAMVVVLTRSL